jgi:hypothetical protein
VHPLPLTMLKTPFGGLASWSAWIRIGVCVALVLLGLVTAVQPGRELVAHEDLIRVPRRDQARDANWVVFCTTTTPPL